MTVDSSNQNGIVVPKIAAGSAPKPLLVMTAAPATGHTSPTLIVARELIKRGFEIIFMTAPEFQAGVEKVGAEYYETSEFFLPGVLEERVNYPPGLPKLLFDMERVFIASIATHSAHLRSLLEMIRERDPTRDVVIVAETAALATLPFFYGAPLPKGYTEFPKTIDINVIPLISTSDDLAPFGPGLPPDASESGRLRNRFLNDAMFVNGPFKPINEMFHKVLRDIGCTSVPEEFMWNAWEHSYDTTFQMCSPGLEYPRSDLHPSVRFAGAVPKKGLDPNFHYPSWWAEIVANSQIPADSPDRKKVIPVAQGTVAVDYEEVIIPTIKAFSERTDIIVVALLGVKNATLPAGVKVPANTRVIDYLPYDAILEHADVFVTNGGYGSMMHGVLNGVPMVVGGLTEDKQEVCARAEYAGFAVNLKTQTPTSQQIYDATDKILNTPSYKARAVRHRQENEDLDSLWIIQREIMKYARKP